MSKNNKKINSSGNSCKKFMIVYDKDMRKQDLLKDIFNQLFDEIRINNIYDEFFISDLDFIIKDFIDNSELR